MLCEPVGICRQCSEHDGGSVRVKFGGWVEGVWDGYTGVLSCHIADVITCI